MALVHARRAEARVVETDDLVDPGWPVTLDEGVRQRLIALPPEAIPDLFRLARANARLTCPALHAIAGFLHRHHAGPFMIPRVSESPPYWVIRWATGEEKSTLDCRSVAEAREDVLATFERWLSTHGYVERP